jgi:hypothetical protein
MKGKVFGVIVVTAIAIGILSYFDIIGSSNTIQVKAHYVEYNCGDINLDMKVTAVGDTAFNHLIGKTISPELTFENDRLRKLVMSHLRSEEGNRQSLNEFTLVGYVRKGPIEHCSGSLCFKVKKLRYENNVKFVEF